jgi:hypothetical protein
VDKLLSTHQLGTMEGKAGDEGRPLCPQAAACAAPLAAALDVRRRTPGALLRCPGRAPAEPWPAFPRTGDVKASCRAWAAGRGRAGRLALGRRRPPSTGRGRLGFRRRREEREPERMRRGGAAVGSVRLLPSDC